MKQPALIISLLLLFFSYSVMANDEFRSAYAGEELRIIKTLSSDDIQQLESGKGWGLAKAAELNGYPGPIHLLQMKDRINLSNEQVLQINTLYEKMKSQAVPLGKQLIELEKELNQAFALHSIDDKKLHNLLDEISVVHNKLRYVHLSAHLETPQLLDTRQIKQYNTLRGYHNSDPCASIPEGHDAEMWKKHNGCR